MSGLKLAFRGVELATDGDCNERSRQAATGQGGGQLYPVILKADRPPAISAITEAYLTSHLTARNQGLSDLLGRDVSKVWGLDV